MELAVLPDENRNGVGWITIDRPEKLHKPRHAESERTT